MGTMLLKIKIMPTSPNVDLEKIKNTAKKIIEKKGGKNYKFEEEPIAFGIKAVISFFSIDESQELEPIEQSLKEIENVSSVQVIDMRRGFG